MTATARPPARIWTANVYREILSNGLTLLVQRDPSAPAAAVVTHVKAGFFDEPDRWVGISHVLEHMFFKGTPRRSVGAIARETKAAGGYLNASTTYDHTNYFVVLPASGLATGLDIQADALRNSVIAPDELARELQVIIQEAKRKLDNPSSVTYETLNEVMFDRHRIRRWRIGYEANLARLTRDDLWGYYRSRYVPERTIVSVVGDFDPEAALDLARRAYGDWAPVPGAVDVSPEEPPHVGVRARTLRGDVTQAELALGWRTVPPLHPDSTALDLAAAVLAAGRGSWLYRTLRQPGIVTSISAYNYAPTELGIFGVTAELAPDRLAPALQGIAESVAGLTLLGPSDEDLERARTLLRARWARRMEAMEGRAAALAAAEALDGVDLLEREYTELLTTGASRVREVAARYLLPDAVSGVAYLPRGEGGDLETEQLASAFAVTALTPIAAPASPASTPASPARAAGREEAEVLHVPLAGADLLVRRKAGVPLVTLGIYVLRAAFDPPRQAGLGALTVRSAVRGAGRLDAGGLAFAFERLGGTLTTSSASDWLGFATTVLSDRLDVAGELLRTVFTEPAFPPSEVWAERGLMVAEAEQVADDMFRFPFQLAFRGAFGEEGYGLPVGGLPETLRAIEPEDVVSWHRERLLGVRPVIIAVGDVAPERAAEALAGVFQSLPARPASPGLTRLGWAVGAAPDVRVVGRDKAQAALAMAFPGPARRDPDRAAAEVWAAIASGLGGRLFEALRDRRSLAYTVLASAWPKGRGGALLTYIATSPEREEEARREMLVELARFAEEPPSDVEVTQAVSYLAGQAEVHRQSAASVAAEILEAWLTGGGLRDLLDPAAVYRAVTAGEVQAVARRYLDSATRAEGVVRGTGGGR